MPTLRQRHAITETDDVARAIDMAAEVWPELRDDRAGLLRRLIALGAERLEESGIERAARRLAAIRMHAGALGGVYLDDDAQALREEWPA